MMDETGRNPGSSPPLCSRSWQEMASMAAGVNTGSGKTLHAMLREMEPGLFRAEYPGEMNADEAGVESFPDSHIGTNAIGVRMWVEQMAINLGYDRVMWHDPDTV